jgi:hypothetical protein
MDKNDRIIIEGGCPKGVSEVFICFNRFTGRKKKQILRRNEL